MKKINPCILFILILTLFTFVKNVHAASLGLSVSPQIFELDVFAGEKIEKKVVVGNISNVALPIEVRVADFGAKENTGDIAFFANQDEDVSISSRQWFEVSEKNFILEPGEKKEVDFSISVPQSAEPGGHYSIIIFEPRLPSFYFREAQPRAIPVIGALFLLSLKTLSIEEPETEKKLEVIEFSIPKEQRLVKLESALASLGKVYAAEPPDITITQSAPSAFLLKIKNNGIYHLKPSGKILVYNLWGGKTGELEVPQKTILPGKTREFPVEFSSASANDRIKWLPASISSFLNKNLFIGRYRAVLQLKESPGSQTDNFFFWALPVKFWLPFILTLVLFIFLAVIFRKRIKAALIALVKSYPHIP